MQLNFGENWQDDSLDVLYINKIEEAKQSILDLVVKLCKKIGSTGIPISNLGQKGPLVIFPNLGGSCKK